MQKFVKYGVLLVSMLVACAAHASPEAGCSAAGPMLTPGLEGAGLARVSGRGPLHFLADGKENNACPDKGGAICQRKAYVVPGDVVVVGKQRRASLRCASYSNHDRATRGWLPSNRLVDVPIDPSPALKAWQGTWVDGENWMTFTVQGSRLKVDGSAFWQGQQAGETNVGEVDAVVAPKGNAVTFDQGDCSIWANLFSGLLLAVNDNGHCGGLNVSFGGLYRRKR